MHNVRAGRAHIAMLFLGGRRYDVCMDVCCESGARVGRLVCGTGAAALCAGGRAVGRRARMYTYQCGSCQQQGYRRHATTSSEQEEAEHSGPGDTSVHVTQARAISAVVVYTWQRRVGCARVQTPWNTRGEIELGSTGTGECARGVWCRMQTRAGTGLARMQREVARTSRLGRRRKMFPKDTKMGLVKSLPNEAYKLCVDRCDAFDEFKFVNWSFSDLKH